MPSNWVTLQSSTGKRQTTVDRHWYLDVVIK